MLSPTAQSVRIQQTLKPAPVSGARGNTWPPRPIPGSVQPLLLSGQVIRTVEEGTDDPSSCRTGVQTEVLKLQFRPAFVAAVFVASGNPLGEGL